VRSNATALASKKAAAIAAEGSESGVGMKSGNRGENACMTRKIEIMAIEMT